MLKTEKLAQSFRTLRKEQILARMNYLCCSSCAGYSLGQKAKEKGAKGYTFYHHQDAASMETDKGTYLSFSGLKGDEAEDKALGEKIVAALTAVGLSVEWEGDPRTRIWVNL